jgi:uncharacterized protein YndB with AHSA1/START domain
MQKSLVANKETFKVSTPSDTDIAMTRTFDAPPRLVFEAMTKPEHVKQWWGQLGDGYSVPVCEIDLRIGGKWRFVNRHPKGEVTFYGEYREITPPKRLVYTEVFADYPDNVSVITADFVAQGDKTLYTAVCRYPSKEVRDIVMQSGMEHGAALSYDQLEALVARMQR